MYNRQISPAFNLVSNVQDYLNYSLFSIYHFHLCSGIFLSLIWGQILAFSQFKNEQNLPKMVYIIPHFFLVLHFGENFLKIRTKIAKIQIHENLHKNLNENMFSFTFLCIFHEFDECQSKQQICYSFILLISIYFDGSPISILPNFDGPNAFFPNSTGPCPNFRKVGKFLLRLNSLHAGKCSCFIVVC